jgi:inosine/xanthosine triphosphate pyrophosphatase family protein
MNILIGTRNEYKKGEMIWFLGENPNIKIYSLDDLKINIKVDENERSLLNNAEKKAKKISKYTNYYVLASDGGNNIPGLKDKWDILRNQRIVGENKSDLTKAKTLLNLMKDLKGEDRKVSYHLALAMAKNGKVLWSKEEITDKGYISEKLINNKIPKYFWIGQLWYYTKYKKVYTKLNKKELEGVRKQGINLQKSLTDFIVNICGR